MESIYEKYKSLSIDRSLICLEYMENVEPFFGYPINAKAIGYEGCIMYCFIKGYGDMVFAANPESCADINVYPLAKSFSDFIRLILACGTASPVEQIIWMNKEQFQQHIQDEQAMQTKEQKEVLLAISKELELSPMENPFEYVKELPKEFDDSKIEYSDEYYDVLGLERKLS